MDFMKFSRAALFLLLFLSTGKVFSGTMPPVQTVFIILMENHNWSSIKGSASAPYINNTLLPMASYCEQYKNPTALHPSLPNYLWLEAGTNFGILNDNAPSVNHQNTTNHFVTLLKRANVSWKSYQEGISGTTVPLTSVSTNYAPKHNPMIYFDDVTGTNNVNDAYGIAHVRPYTELAGDLSSNNVARYNFITPTLCNDMHDCPIGTGDTWLSNEVPKILNSQAYKNNGALFITFDEGVSGDGPIMMIVLSPLARGGGYFNNIHYDHSSTLRTFQEIFNVTPLLGAAAGANDLSDLFGGLRVLSFGGFSNGVQLAASGLIPGKTNILQGSSNVVNWSSLSTNVALTNSFLFTDPGASNFTARFYRLLQLP